MPIPQQRASYESDSEAALIATEVRSFSGPLPSPEALRAYNTIVPNAAERILVVFEDQVAHRHRMEEMIITSDIRRSFIGLWLGFTIVLLVLVASVTVILFRQDTISTIVGGTGIVLDLGALAGIFVYGSQRRRTPSERQING